MLSLQVISKYSYILHRKCTILNLRFRTSDKPATKVLEIDLSRKKPFLVICRNLISLVDKVMELIDGTLNLSHKRQNHSYLWHIFNWWVKVKLQKIVVPCSLNYTIRVNSTIETVNIYRPQGNIFTPVCHSVHGGVCLSACWDTTPPADPPDTRPPHRSRHSPPEADSSIRSTSGRYASYWNAFLCLIVFTIQIELTFWQQVWSVKSLSLVLL